MYLWYETLNDNMILLSSTICFFSPAGRSEHSLSRKYDPRIDDTWDGWPGHEKNWPGEEHTDGHEAQSGSYLYFALYQCLGYYYSVMLKLLWFSSVFRCPTRWADRRWWIPKVIWQIWTPWSPHMEVTSGAPTGDTCSIYSTLVCVISIYLIIFLLVKWHQEGSTSSEISEGDQPSSPPCLDSISQAGGGDW